MDSQPCSAAHMQRVNAVTISKAHLCGVGSFSFKGVALPRGLTLGLRRHWKATGSLVARTPSMWDFKNCLQSYEVPSPGQLRQLSWPAHPCPSSLTSSALISSIKDVWSFKPGQCPYSDNVIIRVQQRASWPDECGKHSLPDTLSA